MLDTVKISTAYYHNRLAMKEETKEEYLSRIRKERGETDVSEPCMMRVQ